MQNAKLENSIFKYLAKVRIKKDLEIIKMCFMNNCL